MNSLLTSIVDRYVYIHVHLIFLYFVGIYISCSSFHEALLGYILSYDQDLS